MSGQPNLAAEVQALDRLDLDALRQIWRSRYSAAPKLRSRDLLRLALAWRIQADAHGGLDRGTRDALRRASPLMRAAPALSIGVKLAREWKGARHEVIVVDGGFLYRGRMFKSLSQIARMITGSRWNGPRFFGLRAEEGAA